MLMVAPMLFGVASHLRHRQTVYLLSEFVRMWFFIGLSRGLLPIPSAFTSMLKHGGDYIFTIGARPMLQQASLI